MLNWIGRQRQRVQAMERQEDINADAATRPAPITEDEVHSSAPRLLVVDDDLFIGRLMIDALGPYYDIEVAFDATEAGHAIERRPPDLIILDIMMPGQDGQEIGHQLHHHARTHQIPFIIVSGDRRIAQKAAAAGAAAYLAKPFDIDALAALVARVLAEHQPQPE
jgi:two-component system, OmpR family, response regulator